MFFDDAFINIPGKSASDHFLGDLEKVILFLSELQILGDQKVDLESHDILGRGFKYVFFS